MPMKIEYDACIDCGACVDPCPNDAIYPGGQAWFKEAKEHPALSDKHYIAWELCTECVGYYEKPQCIENCPVDCIQADPAYPTKRTG